MPELRGKTESRGSPLSSQAGCFLNLARSLTKWFFIVWSYSRDISTKSEREDAIQSMNAPRLKNESDKSITFPDPRVFAAVADLKYDVSNSSSKRQSFGDKPRFSRSSMVNMLASTGYQCAPSWLRNVLKDSEDRPCGPNISITCAAEKRTSAPLFTAATKRSRNFASPFAKSFIAQLSR